MKISTVSRPGMTFTDDHAWIDYNGSVGFVGVSAFKLQGILKIDAIKWYNRKGMLERGTLIAEIHAAGAIIPICTPVNCKFLGPNEKLRANPDLILESPQDRGWVFFISPLKFNNKQPLLSPEDYKKLVGA
jgi:glycine cleavage system H protein